VTLDIRAAETDADLEAWRQVRLTVLPTERAPSVAELRAQTDPQLHLVAALDGGVVGSGLANRSSFGYAGLHVRVVPSARRRGIATALLERLAAHALHLGFSEAGSMVYDAGSLAFAERFGFREIDRQIEQVRVVGDEPMPAIPAGIEVVAVADRPELWDAAFDPFALEAVADMATHRPVLVTREEWREEWLLWPEAMFLALAGEAIVACAGLGADPDRPDRAEQAFTAVAHGWRRQGLASMLKRRTLAFAAAAGIREIYTWTQIGNADMRALNERLGYTTRGLSITIRGQLPLVSTGR
jgi:predicted N-acetyltransferase YhbS